MRINTMNQFKPSHLCSAHAGVSACCPSTMSGVLSRPPGRRYTGLDLTSLFSKCASSRLYPMTNLHLVHLNSVLFSNPSSLRTMTCLRSETVLSKTELAASTCSVSIASCLVISTGGARIRAASWTGSLRRGSVCRSWVVVRMNVVHRQWYVWIGVDGVSSAIETGMKLNDVAEYLVPESSSRGCAVCERPVLQSVDMR